MRGEQVAASGSVLRRAVAALAGGLGLAAAPGVGASEYGCTVLLCLSNPDGPKAVAECVAPINRLFRDLARGRPFPSCELASGPNGRSWAQAAVSVYDPCPAGTVALAAGRYALTEDGTAVLAGIGDGDELVPSAERRLPPKVCVAGLRGEVYGPAGAGDAGAWVAVGLYERVTPVPPAASSAVIHVYIDGQLVRSMRY